MQNVIMNKSNEKIKPYGRYKNIYDTKGSKDFWRDWNVGMVLAYKNNSLYLDDYDREDIRTLDEMKMRYKQYIRSLHIKKDKELKEEYGYFIM